MMRMGNVIALPPLRGPARTNVSAARAARVGPPPSWRAIAPVCRWLGVSACLTLCLPLVLFVFTLFGLVLLPLLPLVGVVLMASAGDRPPAPPANPQLPSAGAVSPALPVEYAAAA